MQRNHIGVAEQFVKETETHAERILGVFAQTGDVVVFDTHAKRAREAGHLLADGAQTNNADRLAEELIHARRRAVAAPPARGDVTVLPDYAASHGEHQHHGVLGDGDGVGAAIVRNRDLGAARGCKVDIVIAGREKLHEPQTRGGPIERVRHLHARVANHVGGVAERGSKLRALRLHERKFEPGGRQFAGDLAGLGRGRNHNDPGVHIAIMPAHRPSCYRRPSAAHPDRRRSLIELYLQIGAKVAPLTPASAASYYNHSVHEGRDQT